MGFVHGDGKTVFSSPVAWPESGTKRHPGDERASGRARRRSIVGTAGFGDLGREVRSAFADGNPLRISGCGRRLYVSGFREVSVAGLCVYASGAHGRRDRMGLLHHPVAVEYGG